MAWPPQAQGTPAPVKGLLAQAVASSAQTSQLITNTSGISHRPSGPAEPRFPTLPQPRTEGTEGDPTLPHTWGLGLDSCSSGNPGEDPYAREPSS